MIKVIIGHISCIYKEQLKNCYLGKLNGMDYIVYYFQDFILDLLQFDQDHKRLQVEPLVLGMYERSVRNCPWCSQLWQRYVLAMERFHKPQTEIKGISLTDVFFSVFF